MSVVKQRIALLLVLLFGMCLLARAQGTVSGGTLTGGTLGQSTTIITNGPVLAISPSSLNFGSIAVGSSSGAQTVTLTNSGNATLTALSIGAAPTGFSRTTTCGATLAASANCVVNVTFSPATSGIFSTSFGITSSLSPTAVALSGIGTTQPIASVSPTVLNFPAQTVGTQGSSQVITYKNTGTGTLLITSIAFGGTNPGDFVQINGCGTSIAGGVSCPITVSCKPTSVGVRSATLTFTDNTPQSPQTANLNCTGVAIASPSVNLTPIVTGVHYVRLKSLTEVNNSAQTNAAEITILDQNSAVFVSAPAFAADSQELPTHGFTLATDGNSSTFWLTQVTGGTTPQPHNIDINLGGSFSVSAFRYLPRQDGCSTGDVADHEWYTSPDGVTFTKQFSGTFNYAGFIVTCPGGTTAIPLFTDSLVLPLAFGTQKLNTTSSPLSIALKNTGNAALSITFITASGNFAQTNNCGTNLSAGSSCTVNVTFTPTVLGLRTGTISFSDNASGSPQTVNLSGTGISPVTLASIAVTPVNPSLKTGLTLQFTATGTYSDSSTSDVTSQVNWTSNNTSAATIGASTGLATAVSPGTPTIAAGLGTARGSTTLTVFGPVITSLTLTSDINPSTQGQFIAITAHLTFTLTNGRNPTGCITISEGTTVLNSCLTPVTDETWHTCCVLSAGSHSLVANYAGDLIYGGSTSNTLVQVVNAGGPPPTLTITTTSLPDGTQNISYSPVTLGVSGGTAPFTWSISAGVVAPGMSLSTGGVLSGTPTSSGTFTPTFTVTDSTSPNPLSASKQLALTIASISGGGSLLAGCTPATLGSSCSVPPSAQVTRYPVHLRKPISSADVSQELTRSVAILYSLNAFGHATHECTATAIGQRASGEYMFLTAGHCFSPTSWFADRVDPEKTFYLVLSSLGLLLYVNHATILDQSADIAIAFAYSQDMIPLVGLTNASVESEQISNVSSWHDEKHLTVRLGTATMAKQPGFEGYIAAEIPVSGGASGSALFSLKQKAIVGIITRSDQQRGIAYAYPATKIRQLLRDRHLAQ